MKIRILPMTASVRGAENVDNTMYRKPGICLKTGFGKTGKCMGNFDL